MKILIVGVGGVGEAIAVMLKQHSWVDVCVLAGRNLKATKDAQAKMGDNNRFPVEYLDASNQQSIESLARKYNINMIINTCPQQWNAPIFDAAFNVGANYMDTAGTPSIPHPQEPFKKCGTKVIDYQFDKSPLWEKKGILCLTSMGVEPGMSDVFARYAYDHLFDEMEEVGVRDGSNLVVEGHSFAINFNIWSCIGECVAPPVFWTKEQGYYTGEPFSEPEIFEFPEGIGKLEVVCVEHEEVCLVPRYLAGKGLKKVTFKFALGDEFVGIVKNLDMLGLTSTEPIDFKGVQIAPRDFLAAVLPNPAKLVMTGKTCAGTWVKGKKNGKPKQVYIYQACDNNEVLSRWGCQAVVAQTAFNCAIACDLIEHGIWKSSGVKGPEAFDPVPFMDRMAHYGFPWKILDMTDKPHESTRVAKL